jgi:heme exporter protein C
LKIKISFIDYLLYGLVILTLPTSIVLSLFYPNVILEQGISHRIFYFHVPVAWVALYAPLFSSVFAVFYLLKKELKWDHLSVSMNVLSILFSIGVLFSGPIWAYSAWGTLWDWTDARLQSFFVLFISLITYFLFRSFLFDPFKKAKFSSFLSILCSLNAILTWGAIRWIENPGNHPGSVLGKSGMDSDMKLSFWFSVISFHLLFLFLFRIIHRNIQIQAFIEEKIATEL